MKSITSTTAFGGLTLILATVMAGPAVGASLPPIEPESALLLAENGSDRLADYRMFQEQQLQAREDEGQHFVKLLERQPTAAGPRMAPEDVRASKPAMRQYKSAIHQDRAERGLH